MVHKVGRTVEVGHWANVLLPNTSPGGFLDDMEYLKISVYNSGLLEKFIFIIKLFSNFMITMSKSDLKSIELK